MKIVMLTRFQCEPKWNGTDYVTEEKRTPVYVNMDNINMMTTMPYYIGGDDEATQSVDKVHIFLGGDDAIIVDEDMPTVLRIIEVA